MNEDIKKQAHSFLVEKGCKSMAENYPAYRIEQMLTEFAERQIKLFCQCNVSGRSEQLVCEHPDEAIIRDKPTDYCLACNRNI